MATTRNAKRFTPQRGETRARLQKCFKEDPFKDGILEEFCEETSMHGFKFLLPQYEPLMRRTFWFVILTSFTIITVYQLCNQIQGFLDNPLAVNIEKEYPDTIDFPVILLCNTMPFRVSKIRPRSIMHEIFTELYKTPKLNISAAEDHRTILETITNTTEYLSEVAFHKNNMIVRCLWKNTEECSADDFETYFVDDRICYAFNTAKLGNDIRSVTQAGEANGLELTLNAETYEAMNGPYTTYGILVGLNSQKATPSASSTIYTMIGASTKIGIKKEEVQYYQGLTCDERPMKYFPLYSRQACVMEKKIDQVALNCSCFPFVVSDDYVARNGTMRKCNLYEHFHCASRTLAEIPNFDKDECPQECHTISFNPTVSQSVISWARTRAEFWDGYAEKHDFVGGLTNVIETSTRYDPRSNSSLKESFNILRQKTYQMINVMNKVNSLTSLDIGNQLDMPPTLTSLTVSDSIDEFETEMLNEEDGLVSTLEHNLEILNSTVLKLESVLNNASLAPFLFSNGEADNVTLDNVHLPPKLLVHSEGSVFLQLFADWVDSLLSLLAENTDIHLDPETDSNLPTWAKILSNEQTSKISNIQKSLSRVTFENVSVSGQNGCLHKEYFKFTNKEGHKKSFSSVDVFTCVLHHWSGPATKQSHSEVLPQFLSFLEQQEQEVAAQTKACTKVLCLVVQGEDNPDCKLDDLKFKSEIINLINAIQPLINDCYDVTMDSQLDIEEFVAIYRNTTLETFFVMSKNMSDYRKYVETMRDILSEKIWPVNPILLDILGNISHYQYHDANMTDLAANFTTIWNFYETDDLTINAINVKAKLQKLIDDIGLIDAITDTFNAHFNSSHHTSGNSESSIVMFDTLTNIYLWGNETEENLQQVMEIAEMAKNYSSVYINDITRVKAEYTDAFHTVLSSSWDFVDALVMDDAFFNRNFLVVNIFFTEVSIDRTVQNRAYDFWSMMSNLGGTCGLWLGFSITTGVEILSLLFRYFMYPFIRWIVDILDGDLDLLENIDEKERRRRTKELEKGGNEEAPKAGGEHRENIELKD